jgi:hypothetical protein
LEEVEGNKHPRAELTEQKGGCQARPREVKMERKIREVLEMLDWVIVEITYENEKEYWNDIPIQSKKGKYWKWGKVGFLYLKPFILVQDEVLSYDPELLEAKDGVLFGIYQSCLSGTKISTVWGKCCICSKKLVYGINISQCPEERAFTIGDAKKEYRDKIRELWFCRDCFKRVVKEAQKEVFSRQTCIAGEIDNFRR